MKIMTRRCSLISRDNLMTEIKKLKNDFVEYNRRPIRNGVLYINPITLKELKQEATSKYTVLSDEIYGLKIREDKNVEPFTFMLREEDIMRPDFIFNPFRINTELPNKYIINKGATILFWEDSDKTIVKRSKDDEYNKRLGFLTAYFQKHSGLTKNQANKYLANLQDEDDLLIMILFLN